MKNISIYFYYTFICLASFFSTAITAQDLCNEPDCTEVNLVVSEPYTNANGNTTVDLITEYYTTFPLQYLDFEIHFNSNTVCPFQILSFNTNNEIFANNQATIEPLYNNGSEYLSFHLNYNYMGIWLAPNTTIMSIELEGAGTLSVPIGEITAILQNSPSPWGSCGQQIQCSNLNDVIQQNDGKPVLEDFIFGGNFDGGKGIRIHKNDVTNDVAVQILPVPAVDFVELKNIEQLSEGEQVSIKLYDLQGKLVKSEIMYSNTLDIRELNDGIYIAQVATQNQLIHTEKIIVQGNRK